MGVKIGFTQGIHIILLLPQIDDKAQAYSSECYTVPLSALPERSAYAMSPCDKKPAWQVQPSDQGVQEEKHFRITHDRMRPLTKSRAALFRKRSNYKQPWTVPCAHMH